MKFEITHEWLYASVDELIDLDYYEERDLDYEFNETRKPNETGNQFGQSGADDT